MLLPLHHVLAASSLVAYTCLRVTLAGFKMQLSRLLGLEAAMASAASFSGSAAAATCNGHDELCGRRYSDVTLIGSHNSAFVGDSPAHNQYVSVTRQLDLGVRFLQAQTQRSTFRQPHRKPLTYRFGEHKQLHFLTDLTVVTLLGFFQ